MNTLTQQYDSYKVAAVINEIRGFDHSGSTQVGVPTIFGMNFQTVSTAQKLPQSVTTASPDQPLPGGYQNTKDGLVPGPGLSWALDYIDTKVGALQSAIQTAGLAGQHRDRAVRPSMASHPSTRQRSPGSMTPRSSPR